MFKLNRRNKEKGQGLVEYALILVLVAIVVIAVLMLLGPIIGGVFSTINDSLSGVGGIGGGVAAEPVPTSTPAPPPTVSVMCPSSGWVDVKPHWGMFSCSPGSPYTYTVTGIPSGEVIEFRNRYPPYNTISYYTVP